MEGFLLVDDKPLALATIPYLPTPSPKMQLNRPYTECLGMKTGGLLVATNKKCWRQKKMGVSLIIGSLPFKYPTILPLINHHKSTNPQKHL